jgi:hypothetical protein
LISAGNICTPKEGRRSEGGIGVTVDVGVAVAVGVSVGVGILVAVGVGMGVFVGVEVFVTVGVGVAVAVGVSVGVSILVAVGVGMGVFVGVEVFVTVGVSVTVGIAVTGTLARIFNTKGIHSLTVTTSNASSILGVDPASHTPQPHRMDVGKGMRKKTTAKTTLDRVNTIKVMARRGEAVVCPLIEMRLLRTHLKLIFCNLLVLLSVRWTRLPI